MHQTPFLSMNSIVPCINPKRAGGGGAKRPPLMFRAICPQREKLSPQCFTTFFSVESHASFKTKSSHRPVLRLSITVQPDRNTKI